MCLCVALRFVGIILTLKNLNYLNIANNDIGSTDTEGPAILLSILPNLPIFNFRGLQNGNWTEGAKIIEGMQESKLYAACKNDLCYGTSLVGNNTQDTSSLDSEDTFSSQSITSHRSWTLGVVMKPVLTLFSTLASSSLPLLQNGDLQGNASSQNSWNLTDAYHPRAMPAQVSLSTPVAFVMMGIIAVGFVYLYKKLCSFKSTNSFFNS